MATAKIIAVRTSPLDWPPPLPAFITTTPHFSVPCASRYLTGKPCRTGPASATPGISAADGGTACSGQRRLRAAEPTDVQRSVGAWAGALLDLADIGGRVLVHRLHAGDVPRFVGGEGHGEVVAPLQAGQAPEIGQALALL